MSTNLMNQKQTFLFVCLVMMMFLNSCDHKKNDPTTTKQNKTLLAKTTQGDGLDQVKSKLSDCNLGECPTVDGKCDPECIRTEVTNSSYRSIIKHCELEGPSRPCLPVYAEDIPNTLLFLTNPFPETTFDEIHVDYTLIGQGYDRSLQVSHFMIHDIEGLAFAEVAFAAEDYDGFAPGYYTLNISVSHGDEPSVETIIHEFAVK